MNDTSGTYLEIEFKAPAEINHIIIKEDYREGHRIREYIIEGLAGKEWSVLAEGSAVGRMKIDPFPSIGSLKGPAEDFKVCRGPVDTCVFSL